MNGPGRGGAAVIMAALIVANIAASAAAASPSYGSALVVEADGGRVLFEHNADQSLPTASMVKMMTALVVVDAIEEGTITWNTTVETSAEASRMGGSQVYLAEGEVFSVRELMGAMLIHSANDAAHALAEATAGSVDAFVRRMRRKGKELGLEASDFHSPHGLPDRGRTRPDDRMSARDLATVGRAVLRVPEITRLARTLRMPFRDGEFELWNRNDLLRRWDAATGIKTGYHSGARFCMTASAARDGVELVAVVMGAPSKRDLLRDTRTLLEEQLDRYEHVTLVPAGTTVGSVRVDDGTQESVPVVAAEAVKLVLRREDRPAELETELAGETLTAPVEAGDWAGAVIVRDEDRIVSVVPAVAAEDVDTSSWWASR